MNEYIYRHTHTHISPKVHRFPLPAPPTASFPDISHPPSYPKLKVTHLGNRKQSCKYSFIDVNRYNSKCKTIRVEAAEQGLFVYLFVLNL